MLLSLIIWYAQISIITIACITCILKVGIQKKASPEKKYILPFCLLDLTAMVLFANESNLQNYPFFTTYVSGLFALCELIFIPFYIQSIIGEPRKLIFPLATFIIAAPLSAIFFQSQNSFTFLITNLYIGYFVLKYIKWLFKEKSIKNLNHTQHYFIIQGISICYIGSTPYCVSGFISYFASDTSIIIAVDNLKYAVFSSLNICMFILFIYAFLKKEISAPYKNILASS